MIEKMKKSSVIKDSVSPWLSPVVLVTKKERSTCFCLNYRKLNKITKKESYLPPIDDTLNMLAGIECFSTLDLKSKSGFIPNISKKTAFLTGSDSISSTICLLDYATQ